jgi:hypothetical protein
LTMMELATDIAIVVGPAGVVYYLIGDPWVSALWIIVGVSIRWYQRRLQEPPYGKAMKGGGDESLVPAHCDDVKKDIWPRASS